MKATPIILSLALGVVLGALVLGRMTSAQAAPADARIADVVAQLRQTNSQLATLNREIGSSQFATGSGSVRALLNEISRKIGFSTDVTNSLQTEIYNVCKALGAPSYNC